jgi:hypothetical protein
VRALRWGLARDRRRCAPACRRAHAVAKRHVVRGSRGEGRASSRPCGRGFRPPSPPPPRAAKAFVVCGSSSPRALLLRGFVTAPSPRAAARDDAVAARHARPRVREPEARDRHDAHAAHDGALVTGAAARLRCVAVAEGGGRGYGFGRWRSRCRVCVLLLSLTHSLSRVASRSPLTRRGRQIHICDRAIYD